MEDLEKQVVVNGGKEEAEEEEKLLMEGMSVLDFDMLCSTVAMQTQGKYWAKLESNEEEDDDLNRYNNGGASGGGFRMWEGGVLDCFDDRHIAIESLCCPCYRFGKNMRRAGFGSCFLQGIAYYILGLGALLNFIAFIVMKRRCFLYLSVVFTFSLGIYLGFFRTQMRKKFNIRGSDSSLDDCIYHLICPCCTLSQESRTLEMNNVQDGTWHGRGDTICVGSYSEGNTVFLELHPPPAVTTTSPDVCSMQNNTNVSDQPST
ncbi:cell number regulator 7-like [Populus alba x Populus x berolinensis]|uniref:Uncharacterized protein n=3 Tax=Populus TaxID=3689 RepID=A0A4U5PP70_POPAL|nr:cell number regulator 7-like [Populus alba]KAJ6893360.1 cell number regulator 7-like [Populus alba x Populus x berolinensis]KAJ6978920.1 cell number regulator 7-like [Populus alba x Populus x berolinensis]TKR99052.1 uncharacterized protein D5086_0000194410 [Populus alba]